MSGCVGNIRAKNYQNLIIGFQVTARNVGDVFFEMQCRVHGFAWCYGFIWHTVCIQGDITELSWNDLTWFSFWRGHQWASSNALQ